MALANEIQLEQVLINLLSNAWNAVADASRKRIMVRSRASSEHVEILAQDSGQGIPEDLLPRIFDPFLTTKEGGKGGVGAIDYLWHHQRPSGQHFG